MSGHFKIDFDWLSRESGSAAERATLAELAITVDGCVATRAEDLLAKTVRSRARLSAFHLATWFASNWWRLRWEPERSGLSWNMSHKVGAVGGGYVWPDLAFCSDGDTVLVCARPTSAAPGHLIRYLDNFDVVIPANVFEKGIDDFLEAVIARLKNERVNASELEEVWREIGEERREPDRANWRKLEAILGFDPDEVPNGLVPKLQKMGRSYGAGAVEEMAAASREEAPAQIDYLWQDLRPDAVRARISGVDNLRTQIREQVLMTTLPWQRAEQAARIARATWFPKTGPVSTPLLAQLLDIPKDCLEEAGGAVQISISAGFRDKGTGTLSVFLNRKRPTGRRFALARLVGDHLETEIHEKLLPATDARTARQKFQRAFAQEFLCPFSDLTDFLGSGDLTDDRIEGAAEYFEVSPLVIKTTLVNKGLLDRGVLMI